MYAYTQNLETETITVFANGIPNVVPVSDIRHSHLREAIVKYETFGFSKDKEENNRLATEAVGDIISQDAVSYKLKHAKDIVASAEFEDLALTTCADGSVTVTYKGITLPKVLGDKFVDMYNDGVTNFEQYFKFVDNIMANPRESVREELYAFLASDHVQLPITEEGYFVAYKGVQEDLYSCTGSKRRPDGSFTTTVLKGKVNEHGQILNEIGAEIVVKTTDVCDDRTVACSQGLHVGAYEYAESFGQVTLAVLVDPRDVVSVPEDCGCQKCRVSRYKVLNVVNRHYNTATVSVDDEGAHETDFERRVAEDSREVYKRDDYGRITDAIDRIMSDGADRTVRTLRRRLEAYNIHVDNYVVAAVVSRMSYAYTMSNTGNGVAKVLVSLL